MDYRSEIDQLKTRLDEATAQKNRAEARLETLEQQEKELLEQIEREGLTPEKLDEQIDQLEREILSLLEEAKSLLPEDGQ